MASFPNGYIIKTDDPKNSFILYNDFNSQGVVTVGYRLCLPNLNNSTNEERNALFLNLQSYLLHVNGKIRLQFRYEKDSNYTDILDKYESDTARFTEQRDAFCVKIRREISNEIRKNMENHFLKREHMFLFLSCRLSDFYSISCDISTKKARKQLIGRVTEFFTSCYVLLKSSFNFKIEQLDHISLFAAFFRTVNIVLAEGNPDCEKIFTPYLDEIYHADFSVIDAESVNSDTRNLLERRPATERGFGFFGDGLYHNILILNKMPLSDLYPFYGNNLINNGLTNFSITVNMQPLDRTRVIGKFEARQAAAQRDLAADPSAIAYQFEVDQLEKTIYRLGSGEDAPYNIEYIVHLWDVDRNVLESNTATFRQIATNYDMGFYMHDLMTQCYSHFIKTLPGYLFHSRWGESLFVLHRSFTALIPFNGTFTGCSECDFQSVYYGDHSNLVCLDQFLGGTPQHFAMFGQSGSGKSVNILSILLQSLPFYSKLVIIEEGASYLMLTRILGGQYIEIDVNNNLCLNYFDTCGVPLNAGQIEFVTNFLTAMCGQSMDDELVQDRAAMLTFYVSRIYQNSFDDWRNKNPDFVKDVCRYALTIKFMLPKQPSSRNTVLDCYFDLIEALGKNVSARNAFENEYVTYFEQVKQTDITEILLSGEDIVRDVAYAFMRREDMPYHSQLVEMIRSTPDLSHDRDATNQIATRLAQYALESGRGCLFDGVTNIDLSNRIIHFELQKMSNASANFKSLVGLVIGNLVKNQITNMPRHLRKMYIFEEAQRFLNIPGGDLIMMQSYAQFRKFNCVAVTITQEAGQLMTGNGNGANVGSIVMGQSKQYFFLKNKDRENMDYFLRYAKMSEGTIHAIMNFPSPEHIVGRKYSSWVYYVDNGEFPIVGVARHYATELVIAVASTSGNDFEQREQELQRLRLLYPNLDEGELLINYLERKHIESPSVKFLQKMLKTNDFSQMDRLYEMLVTENIENQGGAGKAALEKTKEYIETTQGKENK